MYYLTTSSCGRVEINHASLEKQILAVQRDPWCINSITNPGEEVQIAVVEKTEYGFGYIKEPSNKMKRLHEVLWKL